MGERATVVLRLALGALVAVGCGGEQPEVVAGNTEQPAAACDRAFADAVVRPSPAAQSTEVVPDEAPRGPDLSSLRATVLACDDFDGWMVGARAYPHALPDGEAPNEVLRILCTSALSDDEADQAGPCRDLRDPLPDASLTPTPT